MSDDFSVDTLTFGTGYTVVVTGELDTSSAEPLLEAVARLDLSDGHTVAIDLERCGFIDSGGIHALLRAGAIAHGVGKRVIIRSASPSARRVFEICGLSASDLLDIEDDD